MDKDLKKIERHPFTPFLPEGTKVVLCGTFPPKPDKWAMDFFYPNFQNDMWRVFGLLFTGNKDFFYNIKDRTIDKESIKKLLTEHMIGVGETATEVIRTKDNASDKFLEIVTPVNLPRLLSKIPNCKVIATTGEKAASVISSLTETSLPRMGEHQECETMMDDGSTRSFIHWRLPSTSRAYPMALEKKAAFYADLFRFLGIL